MGVYRQLASRSSGQLVVCSERGGHCARGGCCPRSSGRSGGRPLLRAEEVLGVRVRHGAGSVSLSQPGMLVCTACLLVPSRGG